MSPNEAASPAGDPTVRQNFTQLVDMSGMFTGVTQNNVWMVSDGQPSNPPPIVTPKSVSSGNGWTIEFDAGRQDTSPVADKFIARCGGVDHVYTNTSNLSSGPSELNFFFGVDIALELNGNSATATVYLGQGSSGFSNNWWIGGDCISSEGIFTTWIGPDLIALGILNSGGIGFSFGAPGSGPTLRSNVVTFLDNTNTIVGVSPNGQWMISFGQPMNTPPTVTSPTANTFNIELDAGRQDTGPVADQFNTLCGGASNEWGIGSVMDTSPSELNFFFGVDIKLQSGGNTSIVPAYLGQGSTGPANNWWIGGKCISDSGQLSANVGGQTVTLGIQGSGSNEFIFVSPTDSASSE